MIKKLLADILSTGAVRVSWDNNNNVGDKLGSFLLKRLLNRRIARVPYSSEGNLLTVGSILQKAGSNSIVWGSGFISENESIYERTPKIYALRGKYSADLIANKKLFVDNLAFGDPAILLNIAYPLKKASNQRKVIGIIPHYIHENNGLIYEFANYLRAEIISVRQEPEVFLRQMLECDVIYSSSLHGMICADAYGIENYQVQLEKMPVGGQFKFRDYCSGVDRKYSAPLILKDKSDFQEMNGHCSPLSIDSARLRLISSLYKLLSDESSRV